MNTRILLILLALAMSARGANLEKAAAAWQESITAESGQDYATALTHVFDFKSAGGDSYLASVRAGWLSYLNKDYDKAEAFYTSAAKTKTHAITPMLGLVYVSLAQSKTEDVLRFAKAALVIDPNNREVLLIAGEVLFNKGEHRQAERFFVKAHELRPEDPIALSWLGWSRIGQGQIRQAADQFETLMQINPDGYLVQDGYVITHSPNRGGPPPGGPPGGGGLRSIRN